MGTRGTHIMFKPVTCKKIFMTSNRKPLRFRFNYDIYNTQIAWYDNRQSDTLNSINLLLVSNIKVKTAIRNLFIIKRMEN